MCRNIFTFLVVFLSVVSSDLHAEERELLLFMELPKVYSVSLQEEDIYETASAVHVITDKDIRRSGATTIAEALRMAPGIQVSRITGNKWAVTARGFADQFSGKLLVLMDGRSVYTPLTKGVHWVIQDTMLENIDKIEVVRGPGATIWGANAVNGVVNIITKDAGDTQGWHVMAGGGVEEESFSAVRYGGKAGSDTYYRGYVKYNERDGQVDTDGNDLADAMNASRGGFRIDSKPSWNNSLMMQGGAYRTDTDYSYDQMIPPAGPPFIPTIERIERESKYSGNHIMGRWDHNFSGNSKVSFQLYYDRAEREDEPDIREIIDTYDLDIHHNLNTTRHLLTWGLGYSHIKFDNEIGGSSYYNKPKRDDELSSAFLQDKITLLADRFFWTVGAKYEHNDYTGSEYQPSTRLLWTPNERHTVWAAISKAVSTPSRADSDLGMNIPPFMELKPSPDLKSEDTVAYELGYRLIPTERLYLDLAGFYNDHENITTNEEISPSVFQQANNLKGVSYGAEISANYKVSSKWEISGGYSYLHIDLEPDPLTTDAGVESLYEGNSPRDQFHLRSYVDLPNNLEFDLMYYYVSNLQYAHPRKSGEEIDIPSYDRVDVRLGWSYKDIDVSLAVQNLFDKRHKEFETSLIIPEEIERSAYLKLSWRH